MEIKVISTFEAAKMYLKVAKRCGADIETLWQKHMIDPFWPEIAKWAPFDQSFKQPSPIMRLAELEAQLAILNEIDINSLQAEFTTIASALPLKDDDPMLAAFYPLCDSNRIVKERQNGVVGASVFGNMIININPLADGWQKWIPFVFAHEYHHNIWGHNWFVQRGGEGIEGTLLEAMITEGQADLFAESLFPDLEPKWNKPFDEETEKMLWERTKPVLFSVDHKINATYMFGNENEGLPWCMGYSFGKAIVQDYMQRYPTVSFLDLLDISAKEIFEGGKYDKI